MGGRAACPPPPVETECFGFRAKDELGPGYGRHVGYSKGFSFSGLPFGYTVLDYPVSHGLVREEPASTDRGLDFRSIGDSGSARAARTLRSSAG